MRLALILSSNYSQNPHYPPQPACALDGDLLEDRLAEPDARFALDRVSARRKLRARLARSLTAVEDGDTLFYFSGYATLVDGEPKLVLDDRRGGVFAAGKLCELLRLRTGAALVMLDLVHRQDPDNPLLGVELVDAFRQRFIGTLGLDVSLLIAARVASDAGAQPSMLTRLFLLGLERAERERRAVDCAELYQRMREDPGFEALKAVGFFAAKRPLQVLLAPRQSERPAAPSSPQPSSAQPSSAQPSSAQPSSAPHGAGPVSDAAPLSSGRLGKPPPKPTSQREPSLAGTASRGAVSSKPARDEPLSSVSGGAVSSGAPSSSGPVSGAPSSAAPLSKPPPPDPAELLAAGQYDAALTEYKKRLLRLGTKRSPEHAQIYVGMARAKAGQGRADEALHNYDKALSITPLDAVAFAEAKALVLANGDIQRLSEWVGRRAEETSDPQVKGQSLVELGKIWLEHQDPRRAVSVLEAACAADPSNPHAYLELAAAFSQLERPAQAIRALASAGAALTEPAEQATVWIRAARMADAELEGGEEVLELCRRALGVHPAALEALELMSHVLAGRRRYADLAAAYEDALERTPLGPVSFELGKRLGLLYRDQLDELGGARRSFQRALDSDPTQLELYYFVSELYEAERQFVQAARQFQLAARYHPRDPDVYRRALWLFEQADDPDAAWNAAIALESLGEADINESLLADQHRPEGAISPSCGLDAARWRAAAMGLGSGRDGAERGIDALFSALERGALALARELAGRSPWLDGATLQAAGSTATLVRSLGWAARVLGVEAPELWIHADWEGVFGSEIGVRVLPAVAADAAAADTGQGASAVRVLAAQQLGSGLGPPELGFIWGRTLAGLVTPFELGEVYSSDVELGRLLLAGLAIGGAQAAALDEHSQRVREALLDELTEEERAAVEAAVAGLRISQVSKQLMAWRRRVAFGRSRVGLLLAGDLEHVRDLVERVPLPGATPQEVLDDLRAFSISEPYLSLRADLGIAVG